MSNNSPKAIVQAFLQEVRSGLHPEKAAVYMADTVLAHQLNAEQEITIKRTPQNYTEHILDFLRLFGQYTLEVTDLLAENDKVYVRWKQTGRHLAQLDGYAATGLPLIEITSVVYRVVKGKIVEYWLQTDRYGLEQQLKHGTLPGSSQQLNEL